VQVSGAKRIFEMDPPSGIRRYGWRGPAGAKAEVFYSDGNPENAKRA